MYRIHFSEKDIESSGYIGGNIYYDESSGIDFSSELIPFLTLSPAFFPTDILQKDELMTIFLNKNLFFGDHKKSTLQDLVIKESSQENNSNIYKAVKYKKGENIFLKDDQSILPQIYISLTDFTATEMAIELEDYDCGAQLSKSFGRLGYLQADVSFGIKFKFLLQIFETDLVKIHPFYNGIFNDGAIYFFLNKNVKKLHFGEDVGKLFTQIL